MQNQQVELLREDVRAKEAALMKEHFAHSKAEAERQTLVGEVAEVEKAVASSESSAKAQRAELHRLTAIVTEADQVHAHNLRIWGSDTLCSHVRFLTKNLLVTCILSPLLRFSCEGSLILPGKYWYPGGNLAPMICRLLLQLYRGITFLVEICHRPCVPVLDAYDRRPWSEPFTFLLPHCSSRFTMAFTRLAGI